MLLLKVLYGAEQKVTSTKPKCAAVVQGAKKRQSSKYHPTGHWPGVLCCTNQSPCFNHLRTWGKRAERERERERHQKCPAQALKDKGLWHPPPKKRSPTGNWNLKKFTSSSYRQPHTKNYEILKGNYKNKYQIYKQTITTYNTCPTKKKSSVQPDWQTARLLLLSNRDLPMISVSF